MSQTRTTTPRRPPTVSTPTPATGHPAELVDDMDALLDEIDEVLEHNALEITRSFRQRGGQ